MISVATLQLMNKENPIVVTTSFNQPAERVWRAITQREEMVQWYFEQIEAFEPRVGFETRFTVRSGGRNFVHHWRVTEVAPGRKISYDWLYPDFPGMGLVSFQLEEKEGTTQLSLFCWGIESFPQHIPEFSREACKGGWNYFITQRLAAYLAKDNE